MLADLHAGAPGVDHDHVGFQGGAGDRVVQRGDVGDLGAGERPLEHRSHTGAHDRVVVDYQDAGRPLRRRSARGQHTSPVRGFTRRGAAAPSGRPGALAGGEAGGSGARPRYRPGSRRSSSCARPAPTAPRFRRAWRRRARPRRLGRRGYRVPRPARPSGRPVPAPGPLPARPRPGGLRSRRRRRGPAALALGPLGGAGCGGRRPLGRRGSLGRGRPVRGALGPLVHRRPRASRCAGRAASAAGCRAPRRPPWRPSLDSAGPCALARPGVALARPGVALAQRGVGLVRPGCWKPAGTGKGSIG